MEKKLANEFVKGFATSIGKEILSGAVSGSSDGIRSANNKNCHIDYSELGEEMFYGALTSATVSALPLLWGGPVAWSGIPAASAGGALGSGSQYIASKGVCLFNEKKPEMEKMWKKFQKDMGNYAIRTKEASKSFAENTGKTVVNTATKAKQKSVSFAKDVGKAVNKGYKETKKFLGNTGKAIANTAVNAAEKAKQKSVAFAKDAGKAVNKGYNETKKFLGNTGKAVLNFFSGKPKEDKSKAATR